MYVLCSKKSKSPKPRSKFTLVGRYPQTLTRRPPFQKAYLALVDHEEKMNKVFDDDEVDFREGQREEFKREAMACGYVQMNHRLEQLQLSPVGRTIHPIFSFLQPDTSCFLLMCCNLGMMLPGVVAAALDMCEFRVRRIDGFR